MINTLLLDIETTDLFADGGIILCVVGESSKDGEIVLRTDKLNKAWHKGIRGDDSKITKEVIKLIGAHDVIVAHNGVGFDLPFVRSRALYWSFSPVLNVKVIDPLLILWKKFKLRSNRLGNVSDFIGSADRKDPLDKSLWMDAILNGSEESMDSIVAHCQADVKELRDILEVVKPYCKQFDDKGSAY